MAVLKTKEAGNSRPPLNAVTAGCLVCVPVVFDIAVDGKGVAIATGDVLELADLPAGHALVDVVVDSDALASAAVNVGFIDTDGTGDEVFAAEDISAGGVFRANVAGMSRVAVKEFEHRTVAMTFTAGSAATTGTIGATLMYRASHFGI